MKMKRFLMVLLLVLFVGTLSACDFITILNPPTTTTSTTTTISTMPEQVNGTITFDDTAYDGFSTYLSDTYRITNISDYNDVLLATQDHLRKANVVIQANLYEEIYLFPWSETKTKSYTGVSKGSGFVFLEDETHYYAMTNYHVIDSGAYEVEVEIQMFEDSRSQEAEILAFDASLDLAVITFEKNGREDVELIDIYERLTYQFNRGELVLAIGNPLDVTYAVSFGEFKSMESIENVDYDVIYHDALIKEGSSGGALVDIDGYLIGVNTWGYDSNEINSFAIPNYIVYMFLINQGILE